MTRRGALAATLCLLLAGCGGGRGGALLREIDQDRMREQLRGRPADTIDYRNRCSFRDETGYRGSTQVEIEDNRVLYLATAIELPSRGTCSFGGPGFRQTKSGPSLELRHADGCTVRIWTQGRQMTISYTRCEARCTPPQAFARVWPVLIDMPTGRCD
ncbi:MAG: hypothetical protein REI09_14975 [Candidatus Dactylopiibacterium sp.]|nr:hypothetical protein [Candidatus Dactylopiibacterium sp.]